MVVDGGREGKREQDEGDVRVGDKTVVRRNTYHSLYLEGYRSP